jgi:hypothetical protein
MATYKIRVCSSFCDSANCKSVYERLCETHLMDYYGDNGRINITNGDDYTHVLILNTAMPVIPAHIPKKNVVGLAFEPPVYLGITNKFIQYAIQNIGKYYIGDKSFLPEPFVEHYSYMWHITPLTYIPEKRNIMSLMVSNKTQQSGHQYRHILASRILKSSLPIDIYGRGCEMIKLDGIDCRIKGNFKELEPYSSYQFHICIENVQTNDYFSEKITNPLLTSTVPVYLGSKNINKYFPSEVICLSGNIDQDMELLEDICKYPEKYQRNLDIKKIKSTLSLIENLDHMFA